MIEKKYPEAHDALVTHTNRYMLLSEKMNEHIENTVDHADRDNLIEYSQILTELLETVLDIAWDYRKILEELEQMRALQSTALKTYAEFYGTTLIVPEGFVEFNKRFNMQVSVIPKPGLTTITVDIEEDENDSKHNWGRTKYHKVKDWFIQFRQSLLKPKR